MPEGQKRTVALINTTLNAVGPMMNYLRKNEPLLKAVPYLDGYLLEKINKDGGVTDDTMGRVLDMIVNACRDGAEGVILTCTVMSPYQTALRQLFSIPVICADATMLDQASMRPGKTAILCTFEGTVEITRNEYFICCGRNGAKKEADMFTLSDAFRAIQAGNLEESNRLIRGKITELDEKYDKIILAQISMSGAAEGLTTRHAQVYSSPRCAVEEFWNAVNGREAG